MHVRFVALFLMITFSFSLAEEHSADTALTRPPSIGFSNDLQSIRLKDLNQAVYLQKDSAGELTVIARQGTEAAAARDRILTAVSPENLFSLIYRNRDTLATLPVWNPSLQKYQEVDVAGLGAVIAMALTEISDNGVSSVLYLKDTKGRLPVLSLASKNQSEKLKVVRALLQTAGSDAYQVAIEKRNASNTALEIESDKAFSMELKKRLIHQGYKFNHNSMKELIGEPQFQSLKEKYSQPFVAEKLHVAAKQYLEKALDPTNNENVHIEKTYVGYAAETPKNTKEHPKLAIILNTDVASYQAMVARISGAPIEYVNSSSEIERAIKKHYDGTPLGLILGSHGYAGTMVGLFHPNQPGNRILFEHTAGMVDDVFSLGCSVGQSPESRYHILKEVALGWNVPATGFDNTLWAGSSGITFQSGPANRVRVTPNYPSLFAED